MNNCIVKIFTIGIISITIIPWSFSQSNQIDSLENILKTDSNQIEVITNLGEALINIDNKKSIYYTHKALILATQLNNKSEKSKALRILLEANILEKDIDQINSIQKDATLQTKGRTSYEKGNVNYCKGLLNYKSSSYSDASLNFFDALKHFEDSNADLEICKTLKYIGLTFYNQRSPEKAFKYYQKALKYAQKNNFPNEIVKGLNNVAAVYHNQGEYDKAFNYFKQALELNIKNNSTHNQSINYLNLGIVTRDQSKYKESFVYFQKAINSSKSINPRITAAAYNSISKYFIKKNQLDSAIFYAKKGLAVNGAPISQTIRLTKKMHDIYIKKQDTISAYKFEIENRILKDSFLVQNNLMKSNFIELQYNLSKKEDQLLIANQRTKLTYSFISLILLLFGLLGYFVNKKLKTKLTKVEGDKKDIEQTLQLKNKELTSKAMYLIQKNEAMANISDDLNELSDKINDQKNRVFAKKIAISLKKNTNEEVWKEFEMYFQSVHPSFYSNLQKQFSNLTPNEKKLASFLCMNMSSKEISAITGQRIATLEVARSRLRKKLGISKQDVSLPNFLTQFCILS